MVYFVFLDNSMVIQVAPFKGLTLDMNNMFVFNGIRGHPQVNAGTAGCCSETKASAQNSLSNTVSQSVGQEIWK